MLRIDYPSSDEEEVAPATKTETNIPTAIAPAPESPEQPPASSGPVNGPSQVPTVSSPPAEDGQSDAAAPSSPYTTTRALIQNLTLPTKPNFDIPPSPPGSPPQRATKKFAQFLELKKKGQHFNQRLEGSSVLRDPGHLQKLMDFAGISREESYGSTLPVDLAVPPVFPDWAYVEELRASQKRIGKAQEQNKSKAPREAVDFVSATKSGTSSGTGTPSVSAAGKRKELEHRGRDNVGSGSKWEGTSRSPKRRRSRSRDRG